MTRSADNYVLDLKASRRGYAINQLCASLKDEGSRRRFGMDEGAYCDAFGMSPEQKQAILRRDWTTMLNLGASIFYVYKLAIVDGKSMQYLGGVFTGMTTEEFTDVMRLGGQNFGR